MWFPKISIPLWVLYANVALYAACYQMQTPVQPYMVEKLLGGDSGEASIQEFGKFKTAFNFIQLIGSFVVGPLLDKFGCKRMLLLSFVASALSYGLVTQATSLSRLYIAQIPTLFQHAVIAARTYVSITIDSDADRSLHLGYCSVAYGVGMVIGPFIGGILSDTSLYLAAAVSTIGSLISCVFVIFYLEDAVAPVTTKSITSSTPPTTTTTTTTWQTLKVLARDTRLTSFLSVKFLFSAGMALFHGIFSIVSKEKYGLDAKGSGALLSWVGGLGMLTNAFLIGPLQAHGGGQRKVLLGMLALLGVSFLAFAASSTVVELYILSIPLVIGMSVFATVSSSIMAGLVPPSFKGSINSVDMGMGSGVRLFTPVIATALYSSYGFSSIGITSSGIMGIAFLLMSLTSAGATDAKLATGSSAGKQD